MINNFICCPIGSPFKCPVISTMLDGPSMIRVGNTAYMDLEMPGLEGPVSAEVTGKLMFHILILLYNASCNIIIQLRV